MDDYNPLVGTIAWNEKSGEQGQVEYAGERYLVVKFYCHLSILPIENTVDYRFFRSEADYREYMEGPY